MFSIRGVGKAGENILSSQNGEVSENVLLAHAPGEVTEHVTDRHTRSTHNGLSEANFRIENDTRVVVGSDHD